MGSDSDSSSLAERLRYAREVQIRAGFREMERLLAAEGVDASFNSVARYERGERVPPADYVAAVAALAGLSAGWLLAGEGTPHPTPPGTKEAAFDQVADIVRRADRGQLE